MIIQEITQLRQQETNGNLRLPERAITLNNPKKLSEVNQAVEFLSRVKRGSFLSLIVKMIIQTFDGVKDVKGDGSKERPYVISTDLGSGTFYNARECFDGKVYPLGIVRNQCFNNCYIAVIEKYIKNCQILSGIAYRGGGKPFLHSVIRLNDKIIDFNYDICMDEELYMKLFNFEVLNTLSSKKLIKGYPIIRRHQKFLSDNAFSTIYATFAFEDLIDYLQDKNRREKEKVEIALD